MPRLLLFLALLVALVVAVGFAMKALARLTEAASQSDQELAMQNQFSKIAYVLLIVLLFSATGGAL